MSRGKTLYALLAVVVIAIVAVIIIVLVSRDDDEDKTYTVAIVNIAPVLEPIVTGFKEGLTAEGYTEGKNITYLYDGPVSRDAVDATMQDYVDQQVDVILALTTSVAVSAQKLTAENKIPIIFVVTDPIAAGLVTEISHPGDNLTGVMTGVAEERRLEWEHTLAPEAKRFLLPYNPGDASPVQTLEGLQAAAETLGLELVLVETPDQDAVQALIDNLPDDIDGIFLPSDALVGGFYSAWTEKAIERKLPTSASSLAHVEGGILSSYSYSPLEIGKQASRLVVEIFKGSNPGDLPVEAAELFFSLNLKTADAMGLEIPDEVLKQAQIIVQDQAE